MRFTRTAAILAAAAVTGLVLAGTASAAPVYSGGAYVSYGNGWVGQTLTVQPGTWTYQGSLSFAYAWKRGDTTVGTGQSYTLDPADIGYTIAATVTATDDTGSASVDAPSVRQTHWPAPTNTRAPVIGGSPVPGGTVTADPGDWTRSRGDQPGPITFGYHWWYDGLTTTETAPTFKLPANAAGKTLYLYVQGMVPDGVGGFSGDQAYTTAAVAAAPAPPAPPPPPALTTTTNIAGGSTISGIVRWTVKASGPAYRTLFYSDNKLLREVIAVGDNWAWDLDTSTLGVGPHKLGYDVYNQAGDRVFVGTHIPVTVKSVIQTPPPDGTVPGTPGAPGAPGPPGQPGPATQPNSPPQAPTSAPAPTPRAKQPIAKIAGKARLLNGGFAQTTAKQGGQFAVAVFVIRSDTGKRVTAGTVACKLVWPGARLLWKGWYKRAAGCKWRLPAGKVGVARGFFVTKSKGLTLRTSFSVRIRQ